MSSILKALKKLENEKTGRIPDALNLNSDILKVQNSPRKASALRLVLLTVLVFGGGATVAIYFMKDTKKPQTTVTPPTVTAQKNIQTPVPASAVKTETPPEEIIIVPAVRQAPLKAVREKKLQSVTVADGADKTVTKPLNPAVITPPEKRAAVTESIKKELPAGTTVQPLRVNGIAFQANDADNMAIINGTPVSRGSVIEGATVAEIQEDRILFQRNGEKFEIKLGQSNK